MKEQYKKAIEKIKELLVQSALREKRQRATRDWLSALFISVVCLSVLVAVAVYVFFFKYAQGPQDYVDPVVSNSFNRDALEVLVEECEAEKKAFEALRSAPLEAPSPGKTSQMNDTEKNNVSPEHIENDENNIPTPTH